MKMESGCCSYPDCFLCGIKSSGEEYSSRLSFFSQLLKELPLDSSSEHRIPVLRGLWSTAMAHPDDPLLVQLGILESMSELLHKSLHSRKKWLSSNNNIYTPYYAAHILGSYTMNVERHAARAVRCRAVPALAELAAGAMTWIEQRVAVRCLSHVASYESTFAAAAGSSVVLPAVMRLARDAALLVYDQFVGLKPEERLEYHRELVTRGTAEGDADGEERKAEEWASQLQCWSLQVVNCFALREEFVVPVCRPEFVKGLPGMWGGLMNGSSPAGVGLLRTICCHKLGRIAVASCSSLVDALCNVARSSDDWQFMAVDCLLWLVQDPNTRLKVFNKVTIALADLVELTSLGDMTRPGELIMNVLLQQDPSEPPDAEENTRKALEDVSRLRKRIKIEKHMSREDIKITQAAALLLRLEGNARFSAGDLRDAAAKYSEALEVCPIKSKKDRIIIFNNRAQCYLLMGEAEKAVSDTTRALCLCSSSKSVGRHGMSSSLWRRAQAYDMLGLPKESLLDALLFGCMSSSSPSSSSVSSSVAVVVGTWESNAQEDESNWDNVSRSSGGGGGGNGVNFFVAKLVKKQMKRTWLFREAASRRLDCSGGRFLHQQQHMHQLDERDQDPEENEEPDDDGDASENGESDEDDGSEWETASEDDAGSQRRAPKLTKPWKQ